MKESHPPDTPSPARISMDLVESALQRPEGALRVAVVDMGTNSTRLLVADIHDGRVHEVERRNRVTGLGRGVDLSGQLCSDGIDDVCETVREYIEAYERLGAERVTVIATSAVRDAANGDAFVAELRERFALDSRILDGDEEARLTYHGACSDREPIEDTLVVDIGGGSTELIVGSGADVISATSLQCGTVRHTERYLRSDPPGTAQLEDLASDVQGLIDAELPLDVRPSAGIGIAVAGTPTSLAAIDLQLDPYDPDAVHGHRLALGSIQRMCSELSSMTVAQRRELTGLHPDRAPTIVAGVVILIQVMRAFGMPEIEVSEHDILYGAAFEAAQAAVP
jgi:exopolyphosphatase/guanosine-5'-triphosphate,3'-diphosphate pyrophosphatase